MEKLTQFSRKVHLFAEKGPAYYYAYGRWRLNHWLQKRANTAYTVDDRLLLANLDLTGFGPPDLARAVAAGHCQILPELISYFRNRRNPVFFFNMQDIADLISLIPNEQKLATIRAADEVCQRRFTFRGVGPVSFESEVDWSFRPQGNIDWMWDLNRHAYFETLGRAYHYTAAEKYAQAFSDLLADWLAKNPAGLTQPNWSSVFEVGFRLNTWIWGFYYFRSAAAFTDQTGQAGLAGLLSHGRYLEANLERHVPNNHLLLEAKALAFLGLLFPEFKASQGWGQRGLAILFEQLKRQVCTDGVHGERATHYHRVIASEVLELLHLMRLNGWTIPPEVMDIFSRMVEFELWVTKPDGFIPLLNDSALADTYLRFSATGGGAALLDRPDWQALAPPLDEATRWLLGATAGPAGQKTTAEPTGLPSRAFPEGGFYVMRAGTGPQAPYLVFDCGPFGYKPLPSHGHADALSLELYAFGRTMLVDPGVYSTGLGRDWRNFFRGSRAHNTVVVDDQDQSLLLDTRRVYRPAQATLRQWFSHDQFDFVDGSHSGYRRLPQPVQHRRQILFVKPDYWLVVDLLTGPGQHCFDLYFHLMPNTQPQLDPQSLALRSDGPEQAGLIIAPLANPSWQAELIRGATEPIQGWVSFFSGEKEAAPTLRYRQTGPTPRQFCTVLHPYPAGHNLELAVTPLELAPAGQETITGLELKTEQYHDRLVIDRGRPPTLKQFAGVETDAQLFYTRQQPGRAEPSKILQLGGSQLIYQGRSLRDAPPAARVWLNDADPSEEA
jgi:uncharacterized heparinase superfamily protein